MKLQKLEVKRSNGRIEEWQEFWDCYKSSINMNKTLSSASNFSFYNAFLVEQPKQLFQGSSLQRQTMRSLLTYWGKDLEKVLGLKGHTLIIYIEHESSL